MIMDGRFKVAHLQLTGTVIAVIDAIRERVAGLLKGCGCKTGCQTRQCGCKGKGKACGEGCNCMNCTNTDTCTQTTASDTNRNKH